MKNHQRQNKLDPKWKNKIITKKLPAKYTINTQLDENTVDNHMPHLRLAKVDDWHITEFNLKRPTRKATYVALLDDRHTGQSYNETRDNMTARDRLI